MYSSAQQNNLSVYEGILNSFKVNDLQALLSVFRVQKVGKKSELLSRCVELINRPNTQAQAIEKINEISGKHSRPSPYPIPNYNHQHQQNNTASIMNGYRGFYGMTGMGGPMANAPHMQQHNLTANMQPRPARNLTPMPLPFYDPIMTLLEPQELPASHSGNKITARVSINFAIGGEYVTKMARESNVFPRTEVQLRFFNTTGDIAGVEQADDFPLSCAVRLDDHGVTLPNVIPTNKPNVEPKRPSRPVNLTPYVTPSRDHTRHKLNVEWTADRRTWAVGIYLVKRVNADILHKRIVENKVYELPYEVTAATIRKRLGGDDDDVTMDTLKISLLCPLLKTRMTEAARSKDCTHLQCFDLTSFLQMNEKRPTWKCCVCSGAAPYNRLIIDKYFMKMLHDLGPNVTDVELLRDGTFKATEQDFEMLSSDEDDNGISNGRKAYKQNASASTPSTNGTGAGTPSASGSVPPSKDFDIITLSDDDEDAANMQRALKESMSYTMTNTLQSNTNKANSRPTPQKSDDDSIIILDDDTPPKLAKAPSIPSTSAAPTPPTSAAANLFPSAVPSSPVTTPSISRPVPTPSTSTAGGIPVASIPIPSQPHPSQQDSSSHAQPFKPQNLADALSQTMRGGSGSMAAGQPSLPQVRVAYNFGQPPPSNNNPSHTFQWMPQPSSAPPHRSAMDNGIGGQPMSAPPTSSQHNAWPYLLSNANLYTTPVGYQYGTMQANGGNYVLHQQQAMAAQHAAMQQQQQQAAQQQQYNPMMARPRPTDPR